MNTSKYEASEWFFSYLLFWRIRRNGKRKILFFFLFYVNKVGVLRYSSFTLPFVLIFILTEDIFYASICVWQTDSIQIKQHFANIQYSCSFRCLMREKVSLKLKQKQPKRNHQIGWKRKIHPITLMFFLFLYSISYVMYKIIQIDASLVKMLQIMLTNLAHSNEILICFSFVFFLCLKWQGVNDNKQINNNRSVRACVMRLITF